MKRFLSILAIAAVAAFAFTSCEDDPVEAEVALEGITVSPATLALEVGQTGTLTVAYNPENATVKPEVEWVTSDPAVATVANGTVTAVAAGTAEIIASAGKLTSKCIVTVTGGTPGPGPEPQDGWDYTPGADYAAATNLWKPIFDANGEKYFYYSCNGPDFNGQNTETTDVPFLTKEQSTYKLHYENATTQDWQNQFFIYLNDGQSIAIDAAKKYSVKVTVGASVASPRGFLKLLQYGETGPKHEGALIYEWPVFALDPAAPVTLEYEFYGVTCSNVNFVFDFGKNPADIDIFIKDITIVETGDAPAEVDTWDYTPSADYLAETNLWKPVFDGNYEWLHGQITHYTPTDITEIASVKKQGSTYVLTFDTATDGEWGCCNFLTTQVGHFIPLAAGKKYNFKATFCASADVANIIFSLRGYNAGDPDYKYEGAWLAQTSGALTANEPVQMSMSYAPAENLENFTFDIFPQLGTPAGMKLYIKDLIVEEVVPAVPAVFAGTYKVTNLKVLGCSGTKGWVEVKEKSWMWNSSVNKEYDNLVVVDAENATIDYQAGADGAYWDYILIKEKNKIDTNTPIDVSHNFGQLPHEAVSLNVDMTTGVVTIGGTLTAQALTAGSYPFSVDWAAVSNVVLEVPEGSIALVFKCTVMADGSYTWDDSWASSDFDRFAVHPFYFAMILAKQTE